ncbi:MAG: hypothetical protein Q9160_001904 [Pyrenula sp. 1 TL-2023]
MAAPVRSNPKPRPVRTQDCNADPKRLDAFYVRMLGEGGDRTLSEETKWLAVTHKSFDHGRRGFNERLAFLGKRIVDLQASLGLLLKTTHQPPLPDPWQRQPFKHSALSGLDSLDELSKDHYANHKRIARAGRFYGLAEVMRWIPKSVRPLFL